MIRPPAPYLAEYQISARRDGRPVSLHRYLLWLRQAMLEEYPDQLNDSQLGEGGTPNLNSLFLAYVDGSPYARDEDGSYRFPLRAALTFIARGPGTGSGNPFMARFLYAVSRGMPFAEVTDRFGIPEPVSPIYAKEALSRLYDAYNDFVVRAI